MTSVKIAKGKIKELEMRLREDIEMQQDYPHYSDLGKIEILSQMNQTVSALIEQYTVKMLREGK